MLDSLIYTAGITLPIFLMVFLGIFLRRIHIIDDHFINVSSKLVFNISMPALLFLSLSHLDLEAAFEVGQVVFCLAVVLISFAGMWFLVPFFVRNREDRGVFVQGAFRGNIAITGLAYANNMYGAEGIGVASLYLSFMVICINILSIIILEYYAAPDNSHLSVRTIGRSVSRNPLVIAIIVSLIIKLAGVPVPGIVYKTGEYLGAIALPLALLGVGGTFSLSVMAKTSLESFGAAFCKLILIPGLAIFSAIVLGYRGMVLGVMFALFASPTAAASFVMAKAIGGKGVMAANIIAVTTLAAVLTNSLGIFFLRYFGFI